MTSRYDFYCSGKNEILTDWLYGPCSTNPKDYYFKVDKRGRKIIYNRWLKKNNRVPKSMLIDKKVNIDAIPEFSQLSISQNNEANESREREKAYRERIRKNWEDLFSNFDKAQQAKKAQKSAKPKSKPIPKSKPAPRSNIPKGVSVLITLGITTKKEWKNWLLKNHPDKLPDADVELCARVIEEGKRRFM